MRVRVPFGRGNHSKKTLTGIIVDTPDASDVPTDKLKPIDALLDPAPLFDDSLLSLARWLAGYYHYPLGDVISIMLPKLLRQGDPLLREDVLLPPVITWCLADNASMDRLAVRASKQRACYQALTDYATAHGQGMPADELSQHDISKATLRNLSEKGLVVATETSQHIDTPQRSQDALTLTDEQQQAVDAVATCITEKTYSGFLLDGVTGSGKTEVYLQLIEQVIAKGKQALVLVPEIGLTPQTIARFKQRFHANIVMLHSGMTDKERLANWQLLADGSAHIVIGTRSALLSRFASLGIIIVDEEHDSSFKQHSTLRYHARDVALYRGQQTGCPVLLGSATPSYESLYRVNQGKLTHLTLKKRAGNAKPPQFKLMDVRGKFTQGSLSDATLDAIRHTLSKGEQVLIFLNRRGYAPTLLCDACGWQSNCPRCDARLTLHHTPYKYLKCHHCDWQQSRLPTHCPDCHSENLNPVGTGTERLEETLKEQLADYPLIRVDRDTTRRKGSWDKIYQQINKNEAAVLLGTQMLAKGHHFPNVTLVVMPNADRGMLSSDYRAPERVAQLIMQVAGRAGRGEKAGTVLIQTLQPDNPLLLTLVKQGYAHFAQDNLATRQQLSLPPYRHAALVRAEGKYQDNNLNLLRNATLKLPAHHQLTVWGPLPAPMEKKASRYHAQLLLLSDSRSALHQALQHGWPQLLADPDGKYIKLTLDIDPIEWQ